MHGSAVCLISRRPSIQLNYPSYWNGYSTLAFEADFGGLSTVGTSQRVAIFHAINRLKCGKAAGSDKLQPEHIKHGGHTLELWLRKISNRSKYVRTYRAK